MTPLFFGILGLTIFGWLGVILIPFFQFGQQEVFIDPDTDLSLPPAPTGEAIAGEDVYLAQGCVYCHSQQVRDLHQGSDLLRGWGGRRSVARDYMFKSSATLGYMRLGPDLSNIGSAQRIIKKMKLYELERFADKDWKWETAEERIKNSAALREEYSDQEWKIVENEYEKYLLQRLYAPRGLHEWSLMPSYKSLFKEIPVVGMPSVHAVETDQVKAGFQAVPGPEAEALIAYLMSLDQGYALPEASP
ncbi:MAG: cbb3-type cytochrome c oxidase subunit II [Verrucomicrobiota bacterium]